MKKTYEKPLLSFENFAMADGVSSGCYGIATLGEYQCPIDIPELNDTIFTDEGMGCGVTTPGIGDTICYHAPADMNNVYSS